MSDTQPRLVSTVSQVLRLARRLIAERGWAKGELAYNANGEPVAPESTSAVSFCAAGAIIRASCDLAVPWASRDATECLARIVGHVPDFNDAQESVEGVIHAIDEAIDSIEIRGRR